MIEHLCKVVRPNFFTSISPLHQVSSRRPPLFNFTGKFKIHKPRTEDLKCASSILPNDEMQSIDVNLNTHLVLASFVLHCDSYSTGYVRYADC